MKPNALHMKRVAMILALLLAYIMGNAWRKDLLSHWAAEVQKKPDVSVSISEQGHLVKIEGLPAPEAGRPAAPCSATIRLETATH